MQKKLLRFWTEAPRNQFCAGVLQLVSDLHCSWGILAGEVCRTGLLKCFGQENLFPAVNDGLPPCMLV